MIFRNIARAASVLPLLSLSATAQTACNNAASLCDKSYGNVTLLGAHDSAFLTDSTTSYATAGNQYYNSTVQLDAGVRLLSAQVHHYTENNADEWHLCHSSCQLLDAGTLADWLSEIKTWMDANTNDVVTLLLVNSDSASASDLAGEFNSSGIAEYAYTPESTTQAPSQWPTLQSMISNNTRLVTFVASLSASDNTVAPYLLDEFTFVYENVYDNTSPSNFSCAPDRPTSLKGNTEAAASGDRLFMMNHFLYASSAFGIESPNTTYLDTTNSANTTGAVGSLGAAAAECSTSYGKAPWAVLVDYFNVGPAIETVDNLNGVDSATGRTDVPTDKLSADNDSNSSGSSSAASPRNAAAVAAVVGVMAVIMAS